MSFLQNAASKWLKKIFSDLHNAIIGIILGALILGTGAVFLFLERQWLLLKSILLSPTPLWAAIAAALAAYLYIHIRIELFRSSDKAHGKTITELITAEGFKWETEIRNKKIFHISDIPFCPHHELKLTKFNDTYHCTEKDCKFSVDDSTLKDFYRVAINHIERDVRNKYSQH